MKGEPVYRASLMISALYLVIICAVGTLSCASTTGANDVTITDAMKTGSPVTHGFLDDNTFWINAVSSPGKALDNVQDRRKSAKEGAIKMARHYAIESFVSFNIEGANGMVNIECLKGCLKKKFNPVFDNGKILYEKYDGNDYCTIVYMIQSPNLKKGIYSCPAWCD